MPKTGQIKSNFLQSAEPEVPEDSKATTAETTTEEGKVAEEPEKSVEDLEREREERI